MQRSIPIPKTVLANLLAHASEVARLAGHLDDSALADHVDAVVHVLNELLGAARATAALGASIPIPKTVLADLLAHAAEVARLAGHLDDDARVHLVSALADYLDATLEAALDVALIALVGHAQAVAT